MDRQSRWYMDHSKNYTIKLVEWDWKDSDTVANDTITLSSSDADLLSSLTIPTTTYSGPYGATVSTGFTPNTIYTTGTATSTPWFTHNPTSGSARINLAGENADIEVNGWSLVSAVKRIEERLQLFQPNPELESEWAELRELGEQYRQLEQHIRDKQATFDRLKAMPAPDID